MTDREKSIEFHRNYCVHYNPQGTETDCDAGMDIKKIQSVKTTKGIAWGPCIGGHTLDDPKAFCPKWERRSMGSAEKRADDIERAIAIIEKAMPFISKWRNKKRPFEKAECVVCPACNGRLHLFQAGYNGHVMAKCETENCVNFIE